MPPRDGGQRPAFGKPDPFVWIPVVALLIVSGVLIVGNAAGYAIFPILVAALVVLFDARVNRPKDGARRSR